MVSLLPASPVSLAVVPCRASIHARAFLLMVLVSAVLAPLTATAQTWVEDTPFAPILESSLIIPSVKRLVAAPNDKVFVANYGPATSINGRATEFARLNADGTVDTTFAPPTGVPLAPLLAYPDGRVLVFSGPTSADSAAVELIRLLPNGAIDASFSAVPLIESGATAHLLADDRIVVAGFLGSVAGRQGVVVLNANGTVSTAFQSPLTVSGRSFSPQVAPLTDGRFLIVGDLVIGGSARTIVRLLADGTVDPAFTPGAVSAGVKRVYPQSDGRLLVFLLDGNLARLEADGAVDPTFVVRTFNVHDIPGPQLADGKILIVSTLNAAARTLIRINPDGSTDATFAAPAADHLFQPLVVGPDGAIYVAANLTGERAIVSRLRPDGSLDAAFSPRVSTLSAAAAVAMLPDGKVIVAGAFDYANGIRVGETYSLIRLNANGSVDSTFTATLADTDRVTGITLQPDGAFIAAGTFGAGTAARAFARFNANGTRDLSFALPDTVTRKLEVDATGRIYAASGAGTEFRLERFLANGTRDTSFAAVTLHQPEFAIWPDGSGVGVVLRSDQAPRIVYSLTRFSANGTIDPGYALAFAELPQRLLELVAIPDGSVVALGRVDANNSLLSFVRFGPDGSTGYVYRSGSTLDASLPDVAGILLDASRHAAVAITTQLRADLGPGYSVDVTAAGRALTFGMERGSGVSPSHVALYERSSVPGPSVRAVPVVLAAYHADQPVTAVNLGGAAHLGADVAGLFPVTYQWLKDGAPVEGATAVTLSLTNFQPGDAGTYTLQAINAHGTDTSAPLTLTANTTLRTPSIPDSYSGVVRAEALGASTGLSFQLFGNPIPTVTWFRNGQAFTAGTSMRTYRTEAWPSLSIAAFQPEHVGIYRIHADNGSAAFTSEPVVMGLASSTKTLGAATEFEANIHHPNGRIYDQILLTGGASGITADAGEVIRASFVDLTGDIVQVEFAGAGTLSIVLESPSAPALAAKYNQPGVNYVTGHATIVVVDADETTNLTIYSVGPVTALNQSLFRDGETYDGMADLASIAIQSRNGKFGGLRAGNASFFATRGLTGIFAPRVEFTGPVYVGDINAFNEAEPVLIMGSGSTETAITGGNLAQDNNRPIQIEGVTRVWMTDGTDSHGRLQAAQVNQGRLEQDGTNMTPSVVAGP